jgi:hypothetical protein
MFTNTNVRFSNTAQVARTVKFLKENKTTKRMQYTPAFRVKVVDLMIEEKIAADNGKDTFLKTRGINKGEFSKSKFLEACGLGSQEERARQWEQTYNRVNGNTNIDPNVCAVSRHNLGLLHTNAESQGLGELAKETSALLRKEKELSLKHSAKEMGFKLVKVA